MLFWKGGEGRRGKEKGKEGKGGERRGGEKKGGRIESGIISHTTSTCSALSATPNKKVLCKCKIICHSGDKQ